ncbi:MAG: hypothetical protein R6V59_05570 [Dehalococcoidia bacterium]
MIIQRHVNEALFPYQGPVIIRPRRRSGKKRLTRREKRQYRQTPVRNFMKRGVAM